MKVKVRDKNGCLLTVKVRDEKNACPLKIKVRNKKNACLLKIKVRDKIDTLSLIHISEPTRQS